MPRHAIIDRTVLEAAIFGLEHQKTDIDAKLREIRRRIRGLSAIGDGTSAGSAHVRPKRKLSAAARRRIAVATKKRWAEYRKAKLKSK